MSPNNGRAGIAGDASVLLAGADKRGAGRNRAGQPPSTPLLVHALFEDRVREQPGAVAVTCRDVTLTYRDLDDRARALASVLRGFHGVGPDTRVALILDRSEHVLIGMLAVLKAGGAYVPLAPDSPDRRIELILRESQPAAVLTDERYCARLSRIVGAAQLGIDVLAVGTAASVGPPPGEPERAAGLRPDHLAYVIYTSGTTGRPKGVMVEHRSVVNYVLNASDRLGLSARDTCGYSTNLSFDLTVTTTLACLALGGHVAVYTDEVQDLDAYRHFLVGHGVTMIKLTPGYFALVAGWLHETGIRTVVLGGEKLSPSILQRIRTRPDQTVTVYDEYGPTEATVGTCAAVVYPLAECSTPNIGRVYAGYQALVLDAGLRPVRAGGVGELFIGGIGLARGYLAQPELTAERFLDGTVSIGKRRDGAGTGGVSRVYRTGDLVRWLPGGELEYLGRNDDQVKIRGVRVELGEIQHAVESYGDVERAVIVAETAGPEASIRTVVAYVVAGAFGCSEAALSDYLRERLPDTMLPSAYVFLDELPLTANGKVDRAALPRAETRRAETQGVKKRGTAEHRPPRTELERTVAAIWAELLGRDGVPIGVTDDFFYLGGDSIVAIQMLGRLRQSLGIALPVNELLNHRTIEGLCACLDGRLAAQPHPLADVPGDAPLLPIQDWFFRRGFARPNHWNQAVLIATPPLDIERLRACVGRLGLRHNAFRTRFRRNQAGEVVSCDADGFQPPELVVGSGATADLQARLTAWQADFDLQHGPVYRIGYLDGFADGSARIFVACHHLVVDAVSWRVIAEDLATLYQDRALPPVGSTYRHWATAIRHYEPLYPQERDAWQQAFLESAGLGAAALQRLVADETTRTVSRLTLDRDTTERLPRCHRVYGTQVNEVLLAAFAHALADLTGEPVNDIVLEGHGREEFDPRLDIGRTVGWFTTMYPVRLRRGTDRLQTLRTTKETLRSIPAKGVGYGALFGYHDDRLPRINVNYLGRLDADTSDGMGWRLTREPAGEAVHPLNPDHNIITVTGWIADGRLSFTLANKLGQATGELLAKRYMQHLIALIEELSVAPRTYLTPSDIGYVVSAEYLDALQSEREIESVHLATSLQQGFIYQASAHGRDDDAYTVQVMWEYATRIDPAALREAWIRAQCEFPALRLRFGWLEGPVQVVDMDARLDWRFVDLTHQSADESAESLRRLRAADRSEAYDLGTGPLFRVILAELGRARFSCLFSHHHAILDGWSITVLLDRVHVLYEALAAGLPVETIRDRSYAAGQTYLQDHRHDHIGFWRDYLADPDEGMDLQGLLTAGARAAGVRVGTTRRVRDMREIAFTLAEGPLAALRQTASDCGVTVSALFLAVWHKALAGYTGAETTTTGVVVSGRAIPVSDIERSVGLFINTLPFRVAHGSGDETVRLGLQEIQRLSGEFNARSTVPLAELSQGAGRLFDTLFIYENWPKIAPDGWQSRLAVRMCGEYEKLDYPLAVIVSEAPESIRCRLAYAADLFDADCMIDLLGVQRHLLDQILADPGRSWQDLSLLSDARGRQLMDRLNRPTERLPPPRTLVDAFEGQARRSPDRSAVAFAGGTLSYGALDQQANRLAHLLVEAHAARPQELVVLCLDKGPDLIASILAVLKAGAAYVLSDPAYPDRRLSYILEDTAARLVITTSRYAGRLSALGASGRAAAILILDSPDVRGTLAAGSRARPAAAPQTGDLMYVLYTSGTTGVPKGVMIEHGAYGQTIAGVKARHFAGRDALDTHSLTHPAFDIFALEFGLPLWTGGCVGLETGTPATLDCAGLDFVQMTPGVCELMLDRLVNVPDGFLLLIGGERLPEALLDRVLATPIDLVNVYGPTETTIWSTSRLYRSGDGRGGLPVSIGLPLAGETAYVLDRALRLLPPGATGELCIGGSGLARGYLNQEDLTAERFVNPPPGPGRPVAGRLYRTGDLVRLLPSGALEFVGRRDTQVKIDGHRIEIGEVEAALGGHPAVRQAVVVSLKSRSTVLVGYYVADTAIPEAELAGNLRQYLLAAMMPARYVHLATMPLTISGKVDRAALPGPDLAGAPVRSPPRSRVEADLCAMMAIVLGRDPAEVGIDDDFFQLGGTSLRSIKLVAAMERELGIAATVGDLLAHRTIRAFVETLRLSPGEAMTIPAATFTKPEEQALSFAQERLWFIDRFAAGTTAYNLPLVLEVADDAETGTLLAAVRGMIARHDVLRTLVKETPDGVAYQAVLDADALGEITVLRAAEPQAMHAAIRRDLQRAFDLGAELPVRVCLYDVPGVGRRLVFVIHHIAFDGWSTDILLEDLQAVYHLIAHGTPGDDPLAGLPVPPLRYRDFAVWQRDHLAGERLERLRQFWQEKLEDYQDLHLVPDRPWPDSPDYRGADIRLDVGAGVSRRLRQLARELQVSLFSLLLSAYVLTLRGFTNQDDIVVGSPMANRDHPQLARLVGFFVNTLPLRSRIDGAARIVDHVHQTASEVLEALAHQELPFEQLLTILDVKRNISRHPIFQVTFGVHGFGAPARGPEMLSPAILRTSPDTKLLYNAARFDLSASVDDSREALEVAINYATSLFEPATVDSIAQTYLTILRQFADLAGNETRRNEARLSDLAYVDGPRRQALLEWSAPQRQCPSEMLLHRALEQNAARLARRVALVWEERRFTYQALNAEANRLAHCLLGGGTVAPNAIVMLCLDRSADLVISILAVLKAGGAYLPADPTYPDDRIAFLLRDAGVRTVLTHARYLGRFAGILARTDRPRELGTIDVIAVDDPMVRALIDTMPETNPATAVAACDLAYVLYTSGTTGKPKGVPQPHANVARLFTALEGIYHIRDDDVWTLFHNLVFDFTVWEMWGALLYGGRLVIPTFAETRDPELYYALCRRERVTMLCLTPTAFYQFVNVALAKDESDRLALRYGFFGGEPLNVSLLTEWFARYGYDRPFLAMGYGTTETTVYTCHKIYDETDAGSADIGALIPDVAGYVLDGQQRLLPMGAVGELSIGGAGLAPGFLNLPDLTASKFIANPFVTGSGTPGPGSDPGWNARLYRSGDLVRWAPDRSLRFVGRNDLQVKIRGHRIELGEIEAVIASVPGVLQSAVVVRKSGTGEGESRLVGYYVADPGVHAQTVFERLRATVPAYMVPAALVRVDALPRKISGKLDVDALPVPQPGTTADLVPPRDEWETRARRVFAEVLAADPETIGVHDSFFDLGGNSILSIRLASRLSAELDADISIAAVFRHGSVAGLVNTMGRGRTRPAEIPRAPDTAQVLSFQQEWLWFVDRYEGGTDAYNTHLCYEVLPGVDADVLEDGFRAVYERHEVLRTVIRQQPDGTPDPVVLDTAAVPLTIAHATIRGTEDLAARVRAEASRQFNLAEEPPFRMTVYRDTAQGDVQGRVFVGIFAHHIAFDGWSADVMLHEVERVYAHARQRRDGATAVPALPALGIQYRDYAAWERARLSGDHLRDLIGYWTGRLAGRRALDLPLDRPRPPRADYRGERVVFEVDADTASALRRLAGEAGVGLFNVLLSAYYLMLQAFAGRSDLLVGVPVANRPHGQTHDLIGCFVNALALDFEIDSGDDILALVRKVGARVAEAQEHQGLPFGQLVAALNLPVDHSRHPLVQVWFDVHAFAHIGADPMAGGGPARPEPGPHAVLRYHALDGRSPYGDLPATTKKLDLGLVMVDGKTLFGTLTYAASLFERPTVERFASVYQTILMHFAGPR